MMKSIVEASLEFDDIWQVLSGPQTRLLYTERWKTIRKLATGSFLLDDDDDAL